MNRLLPLLLLAALMLRTGNARAQTDEHRIQSVFIYNFTKYFNWKKDADPEFVIGVLGGPALKAELDKRFEAKPTVDGKLRFELNKAALQKNNILASSEIERLSIIL